MQPRFLSWKMIVSVGAALALLLIVGPTSPTPALAGEMGGGGHHVGGSGHWGGGGGGVGIGVGSILLNEAIRRSQERHQAAEPQGCPPGLVPSRKGCVKPGKNKGPEVTKCEPPMQWRKGKGCAPPKGPEVAKCEAPMQMRKGRCVPPKEPEVAKCEHGDVYRKGKGCVPSDHGPETASCDRPFVRVGRVRLPAGIGAARPRLPAADDRRRAASRGAGRTWSGTWSGRTAATGSGYDPALCTAASATTGLAVPAEAANPVAGENPAGFQPLPAGRPLRPLGADLRQTSGARSLSDGLPAEACLLHAGRA